MLHIIVVLADEANDVASLVAGEVCGVGCLIFVGVGCFFLLMPGEEGGVLSFPDVSALFLCFLRS
jgi:hypothetical protein